MIIKIHGQELYLQLMKQSENLEILFVMVVGSVSYWAWPVTEGNIVMWAGTVIMVSTALLSLGWWLLSLAARNRVPRKLTSSVGKVTKRHRKNHSS